MRRTIAVGMAIELLVFALLLFGGAGTWRWAAGWRLLVLFATFSGFLIRSLEVHDPELLAERMKAPWQKGQPMWDKVFMGVLSIGWCAWMFLMGRHHVTPPPLAGLGVLGLALGNLIVERTFRENPFTAPVVKIQAERHHRVIDTGPYAIVRHPMYTGAILYIPSMALILGSSWGLATSLLFIIAIAWRSTQEEAELAHHLPGYDEYRKRVRYRMIPGVW
ncbi:MAG TPA: isoprenylcysteine carboxylmethyltransferase family protein [Candidatus Xenobia bacterium]|jgi:protein-S-isoprenylcysteine O-methyltransferase Ste14